MSVGNPYSSDPMTAAAAPGTPETSHTAPTVIYEARIDEIGPMVPDLLDAGILIFFGSQAPPELREVAIVHTGTTLAAPLASGDILQLGDARYLITSVGEVASDNFAQLGHIVIKANGAAETELPGEVSVEAGPLYVPDVGASLRVMRTGVTGVTHETSPGVSPHAGMPDPSPSAQPSSTQPIPPQHHQRRSLWAFLNAWRSLKRRATASD